MFDCMVQGQTTGDSQSAQFWWLCSIFTWLGHRPLLAQESFAGLGRLPYTDHVGGKHAELIQMTAVQVAHLKKRCQARKKIDSSN